LLILRRSYDRAPPPDFGPTIHPEHRMRSVVVTGTSTGIGWGTTKVLIARGFRVFGSVRKKADAERLSAEFGNAFVPLVFDVTDEDAVGSAAARVGDALAGEKLFGLVNNAGVAVAGPLLELPLDEFRKQIDINLTGVVITTKAFGPLLGTDRTLRGTPGRIVNISSVGGKNAVPFLLPDAASKFALEGLSEGLRRELLPFGIDVIVIAPGAVATPIWAKADQVDITPYLDTPYAAALERMRSIMLALGKKGLPPERIGEAVFRALTTATPCVRYTVTPQPLQDFLARALPKRIVDRLIGGQLGLLPASRHQS
jgi:NAD(P)-dependent dehydrogenase (short-subunit alcohol dehydrogenase family)